MKLLGLFLLVFCVFGGFIMAGGELIAIWQPAEVLMIAGGATGAFFIANPIQVIRSAARHMLYLSKGTGFNRQYYDELLILLYTLFDMARKKGGNKALEDHIEAPESSNVFSQFPRIMNTPHLCNFIIENLRLSLVDGVESHEYESILDLEIESKSEEMMRPASALQTVADALPGFGILAAVLGIVITMQSINGPMGQIGQHIAAALTGTFLGVFLAYGIVGPIASAITHSIHHEIKAFESTLR